MEKLLTKFNLIEIPFNESFDLKMNKMMLFIELALQIQMILRKK